MARRFISIVAALVFTVIGVSRTDAQRPEVGGSVEQGYWTAPADVATCSSELMRPSIAPTLCPHLSEYKNSRWYGQAAFDAADPAYGTYVRIDRSSDAIRARLAPCGGNAKCEAVMFCSIVAAVNIPLPPYVMPLVPFAEFLLAQMHWPWDAQALYNCRRSSAISFPAPPAVTPPASPVPQFPFGVPPGSATPPNPFGGFGSSEGGGRR